MKPLRQAALAIVILFTASNLFAQVVFTTDFETGVMPSGWSQTTNATDGGWKFGTAAQLESTNFSIDDHTKMACTNDDACDCDKSNDFLKTSAFSLSGLTNPFVSFDCYFAGGTYNGATEVAQVYYSTNNGGNWSLLQTVAGDLSGWHTLQISLSAIAGQSSVMLGFKYNDDGDWLFGWAIDNVSVFVPSAQSATLQAITPTSGYHPVGSSITMGGTLENSGSANITSFTVKYNDGTTTYTDTKSVNIAPFGTYTFTHNTPYIVPSGSHVIKEWIEVSGDLNHADDTMSISIDGILNLPAHHIVFEEATGTWCGWCVRGIVFMDSMAEVHPDATLIAVHNSDPMTYTAYDNGVGSFPGFAGYPSIISDRMQIVDPMQIFDYYDQHINDFAYADIGISTTFDSTTNLATADVTVEPAVDMNGDYRLACVFTEDDVTGTGSTWDQHNYYSYQSQNLPLEGQGVNYQSLPQVIPASQMHYNHVARTILSTFNGTPSSLPASMTAGNLYTHTFTYTVPSGYGYNKMKVSVILLDHATGYVLNSNTVILGDSSSSAALGGVVTATDSSICKRDTISLSANGSGGLGSYTYTWLPQNTLSNPFIANPSAYPSVTTTYTVTINDGANSYSSNVTIQVDSACVWPGDADNNGTVNNCDVLAMGVAFGASGTVRADQAIDWSGKTASSWVDVLPIGTNEKYCDANGNGVVSASDTIAVNQNYRSPKSSQVTTGSDPTLLCVFPSDSFHAGDMVDVAVMLGADNNAVSDAYGIAFTIGYDPTVIDSTSIHFTGATGWMGTPGTNLIAFGKNINSQNRIDGAVVRTDQTNVSGYGQIGTLHFKVRSDAWGAPTIQLATAAQRMIDNAMNILNVNGSYSSASVISTGIDGINTSSFLNIYPNPATDNISIESSMGNISSITIHDVLGRQVLSLNNLNEKKLTVPLAGFSSGVYLVNIKTDKGEVVKKVVVE